MEEQNKKIDIDEGYDKSKDPDYKKCLVPNCNKYGRVIGRLANKELVYCHMHEDMGVRTLNFLINSKFRYKFTKYLEERRQDLFMNGTVEFCDECNKKIEKYVTSKIQEIDKLEK